MGETAPERLFYSTIERDTFRVFAEKGRGRGFTDGLDPHVFGTTSSMVAVTFDARGVMDRKWSALAAHRSAFGMTQEMFTNPPPGVSQMLDAFRPVLERETFALAGTWVAVPTWPLSDFFDGLLSADFAQQ
jgi:LmbE family N-acetylglucosaminyl deacetylase